MKANDFAAAIGARVITVPDDWDADIKGVYTCDLLSFAMGRLPEDYAWVTVMGNINAVAVAALTDCACIIIADGAAADEAAVAKARQQDIAIFAADTPVFETAKTIDSVIG